MWAKILFGGPKQRSKSAVALFSSDSDKNGPVTLWPTTWAHNIFNPRSLGNRRRSNDTLLKSITLRMGPLLGSQTVTDAGPFVSQPPPKLRGPHVTSSPPSTDRQEQHGTDSVVESIPTDPARSINSPDPVPSPLYSWVP
jgi:hypothetical protein